MLLEHARNVVYIKIENLDYLDKFLSLNEMSADIADEWKGG